MVPLDDLLQLEAFEDRIDLVEARAVMAQVNTNGAKPLDVLLKELEF